MNRITILFTTAALIGPVLTTAQTTMHFDGTIPVVRGSTTLDLAWASGLNAPQAGQVDLNLDGLKDLVFFDRTGDRLITLLNTGGTGTGQYRHTREFDHIWPFEQLHDWVLFRDYDCDGQEDIFTYSLAGFSVFRNTSSNGNLSFELLVYRTMCDYVFVDGTSQRTNLLVSADDIPGIADIDGDGDLDVLTFAQLGTFVEYYKNLAMETHGTCDSLVFVRRNACWGSFAENTSTNAITLNTDCFQVPNPEVAPPSNSDLPAAGADRSAAHAGSTITPVDLDGDGVQDLLLGDIAYANVVALHNGGTVSNSLIVSVDNYFPSDDVPADIPVFPAAFHLDVDRDGQRDLIISPAARGLGHNYESVWYYHNAGTDQAPDFQFQQRDLFQDRMLDFGEGANPVPFDHNGDGLMDLIISNEGYYHPTGNFIGKLALLENIGTVIAPSFRVVTDDYMNLSTSGIGTSMFPAFADVDGDGDQDMYIGDLQGRLHFFRNTATGPVAQFTLVQPNITYQDGSVIDVGRQATPQFVDLDRDGLIDLVVGEQNGNLNYIRNIGTATAPSWTLVTDSLGHVSTVTPYTLGHSVPFLFTNPAGQYELLVGSESGTLWHYTGIEGDLAGTWTLADSNYLGLDEGYRSTVCLYDYTGDGGLDMVVGNYRGGVSFWRSGTPTAAIPEAVRPTISVRPNPTQGLVTVVLPLEMTHQRTVLRIRNAMGQLVGTVAVRSTTQLVDLGTFGPGMYIIQAEIDGKPQPPFRVMVQH